MSNDTTKACTRCGEEKPVSEFYPRSVAPHLFQSECKACVTERSKGQIRNKNVSVYPAEDDVIKLLAKSGIHAELGKAINKKHVDVVAWGCVRIEVKSSTEKPDGGFSFTFNPSQRKNKANIDAVVLVCMYPERSTYHVFRSNHPVLCGQNDEIKGAVDYKPNAKRRHAKLIGSTLTFEIMTQHENRWDIIDQIRVEISESLQGM